MRPKCMNRRKAGRVFGVSIKGSKKTLQHPAELLLLHYMHQLKWHRAKKKLFRHLLLGLIPGIMLMVWAHHIYMVQAHHLDPWLGGGMRMFAFTDNHLFRKVLLTYKVADTTIVVNARSIGSLFHVERQVRVMPGRQNLQVLAGKARTLPLVQHPENGAWYYDSAGKAGVNPGQLQAIQVFAYTFNGATGKVSQQFLTGLSVAAP